MTMRKWMNLLESESVVNVAKIRETFDRYFTGHTVDIDPKTGIVSTGSSVSWKGSWKLPTLPVKFGDVRGSFSCDGRGLETLENGPSSIEGDYYCDSNHLDNIKNLPKKIRVLAISNNNPILESFEGIEIDSDIERIYASYTFEVPVLRLLVAKTEIEFSNNAFERAKKIEDILNINIQTYSNIKERIYRCQYALIKAGFRGNARW